MAKSAYLSSAKTAKLKEWKDKVELGKQICAELKLDHTTPILPRWMALRVAELIKAAEKEKNNLKKESVRRDCTSLILRLWEMLRVTSGNDPSVRLSQQISMIASHFSPRIRILKKDEHKGSIIEKIPRKFGDYMDGFIKLSSLEHDISIAGYLNSLPNSLPEGSETRKVSDGHTGDVDYQKLVDMRKVVFDEIEETFGEQSIKSKSANTRRGAIKRSIVAINKERNALLKRMLKK